jgi:hypothetical protein
MRNREGDGGLQTSTNSCRPTCRAVSSQAQARSACSSASLTAGAVEVSTRGKHAREARAGTTLCIFERRLRGTRRQHWASMGGRGAQSGANHLQLYVARRQCKVQNQSTHIANACRRNGAQMPRGSELARRVEADERSGRAKRASLCTTLFRLTTRR